MINSLISPKTFHRCNNITTNILFQMLRSIFVLFTVLLFIISSLASPLDLGLGNHLTNDNLHKSEDDG